MAQALKEQELREAALAAARYAGLALPKRPRLAPWLIAIDLGDSRLELRSAESSSTLTHPLLIQVFHRIETILDGRHTVDEIVSSAGPDVLPTTVIFLLKLLQGKSLLQPGLGETTLDEQEQAPWRRQIRFLGHFLPDASSAQSQLAKARLGLVGSGELLQAIRSAVGSAGVGTITELRDPAIWSVQGSGELANVDLIVACQESPGPSFFDAVNRACLTTGTRWLRVSISGTSAQLGPTIVPNQTACNTCLESRLQSHQRELDGYLAYRDRIDRLNGRGDEGSLTALWSAIAGQAALEVMRLITGFAPPVTIGRFYELSAVSPAAIAHEVLKVPRCASCGRRRTFAEAWDQSVLPMDLET